MFSGLVEASIVGMSRSIYLSSPCVACLNKVHAKKNLRRNAAQNSCLMQLSPKNQRASFKNTSFSL